MHIRVNDPRDFVLLVQKLQSLMDMAYLTRSEAVFSQHKRISEKERGG